MDPLDQFRERRNQALLGSLADFCDWAFGQAAQNLENAPDGTTMDGPFAPFPSKKAALAARHTIRTAIADLPDEARQASHVWLLRHNLKSHYTPVLQ